MLASRVAGYKLGLVVVLLLIPTLYFGTELTLQSMHNWRLANANRAAVDLVDLTFRTMTDLASGWSVSDKQKELLYRGPALAMQTGVDEEFRRLQEALTSANQTPHSNLIAANMLIVAVGNGPLMNDAGNREANSLATAGGLLLPEILIKYHTMQALADGQMHSVEGASAKLGDLTTVAAELAYHAQEFGDNIEAAKTFSIAPDEYDFLQRNGARLTAGAEKFKTILYDQGQDPLAKMQKASAALRGATKVWTSDLLTTWVELHDRLIIISDTRVSDLRFWIARTATLSVAAILFGIGTAVHIFRSTLFKLDELESSKHEAVGAQSVAESSARELEQLNDNLANMNSEVSQHLKALENAQEQLVKKGRMEQMGQLTATMAHELRNPLGAARTSIFLLERKTRDKGLGVESQIQRITNAIMRCDDIITQLLDFSRTKKLSPTSADFDAWLERTVTEEALRLPQVLSISCQLGTAGVPIAFDPSRMQRAVTNLLNNASEAMVGNGDDTTKYAVADPRIEIASIVEDGMLRLTIADNGPGITPENLARVREPLFTTKSFGTGLGLPAVEQIAAQHGGSMHITSELGLGTIATIFLPLETRADAA